MRTYYDRFPLYEELISLKSENKNEKDYNEYIYNLGQIFGTTHLRITYNEDNKNCISLDYIECGYAKDIFIQNCPKQFKINTLYKLNKYNYKIIVKGYQAIINNIQQNINNLKRVE